MNIGELNRLVQDVPYIEGFTLAFGLTGQVSFEIFDPKIVNLLAIDLIVTKLTELAPVIGALSGV